MASTSYAYLKTDTLTNDVNISKLEEEITASNIITTIDYINLIGNDLIIYMTDELSSTDETTLNSIVAAHEHITTAESLKEYLDDLVFPFINSLINTFAAENIAMGITQAGKTADVLAIFELPVNLGNPNRLVSLKGAFDTGSLYVSIDIINYHITNISNYSDLTPFVTTDRLVELKTKIEEFLGI